MPANPRSQPLGQLDVGLLKLLDISKLPGSGGPSSDRSSLEPTAWEDILGRFFSASKATPSTGGGSGEGKEYPVGSRPLLDMPQGLVECNKCGRTLSVSAAAGHLVVCLDAKAAPIRNGNGNGNGNGSGNGTAVLGKRKDRRGKGNPISSSSSVSGSSDDEEDNLPLAALSPTRRKLVAGKTAAASVPVRAPTAPSTTIPTIPTIPPNPETGGTTKNGGNSLKVEGAGPAAATAEPSTPVKKKAKPNPRPGARSTRPPFRATGPIDLSRQCGVIVGDLPACTRSLTCKSHSMSAKRSVVGREKPYDILLQEYQARNAAIRRADAIARGEVPPPEPTPKPTARAREVKKAVETAAATAAATASLLSADEEADAIIQAARHLAVGVPLSREERGFQWPRYGRQRGWLRMGVMEGLRAAHGEGAGEEGARLW